MSARPGQRIARLSLELLSVMIKCGGWSYETNLPEDARIIGFLEPPRGVLTPTTIGLMVESGHWDPVTEGSMIPAFEVVVSKIAPDLDRDRA